MKHVFHHPLPKLDMNPMVDLAFLLVSFFMLATTFKTDEAVDVRLPTSTTEIKLPEKDIMIITIAPNGAVYFSLDSKFSREALLMHMARKYQLEFEPEAIKTFTLLSSFGMPIGQLPSFLSLNPEQRQAFKQSGIPTSKAQNELMDWVVLARITNPRLRVAIKSDESTPYEYVSEVVNTLIDNNVLRFNLITQKEHHG